MKKSRKRKGRECKRKDRGQDKIEREKIEKRR